MIRYCENKRGDIYGSQSRSKSFKALSIQPNSWRIIVVFVLFNKFQPLPTLESVIYTIRTSCRQAAATICPRPSPPYVGAEAPCAAEPIAPADRNVAVGSHGQYVPTATAAPTWRVNAAVSKATWWPWPLTFWPWKWCPRHVWPGLGYLCANFSLPMPLCSRLRPDVRDRQPSDSIIA